MYYVALKFQNVIILQQLFINVKTLKFYSTFNTIPFPKNPIFYSVCNIYSHTGPQKS